MSIPSFSLLTALHGSDPLLAAEASRLVGDWKLHEKAPDLMDHLRTSRFNSKVSALYSLVKLSPPGLDSCLEEIFHKPNVPDDFYWVGYKGIRTAAAIGLHQRGNASGLAWLRELASKKDPVIMRWFAPALLRLPQPSPLAEFFTLDLLCDRKSRELFDPPSYSDPGQLCLLCEALGLIEDPQADDPLEFYMNFHSRFVRGAAYRSLFQRHPDEPTREKIRNTATRHGTDFDRLVSAAIRGEIQELGIIAESAKSAFDRASAVDALASLPTPESEKALCSALKDPDPYVRQCAVEGLGRTQTNASRDPLDTLSRKETDLRVLCALEAISKN